MSLYKTTVDTTVRNSSHTIIVEMIGRDARVLDVGCASGYLGAALIERGCEVSGVEIDAAEAETARGVLSEVKVADLNSTPLDDLFEPESFDRVIFGDVLEHLLDPARALRAAKRLLRPGGSVVVSVPNVAHGSVRLALLQGRWDYRDTGLLDRTHIAFFTHESLMAMIRAEELVVTEMRATVFDVLGTEVEVDDGVLPPAAVDWVRHQPHAEVYQFVLTCTPAADGVQESTVVEPAVPLPAVEDEHSRRAALTAEAERSLDDPSSFVAEVLELRHQVLRARDHAIGQEAQLGVLRSDLAVTKSELGKALADAHYAHTQWGATIAHSQNLQRIIDGGLPARVRHAAAPLGRAARSVVRRVKER